MKTVKICIMSFIFPASTLLANIEFCRFEYRTLLGMWTHQTVVNPFYDDYYHVFLKNGDEILSFEPQNKEKVGAVKAEIGYKYFDGAYCEKLPASNNKTWQDIKAYFARQALNFSYDVYPTNKARNGHLTAREALLSVGLKAQMDANLNAGKYSK